MLQKRASEGMPLRRLDRSPRSGVAPATGACWPMQDRQAQRMYWFKCIYLS